MFELQFSTDNAAFSDGMAGQEIARILRKIASAIECYEGEAHFQIYDINGNRIGACCYAPDIESESE